MKVNYMLTGIDEEGNIVLEHTLEAQEVIDILTNALKKDVLHVDIPTQIIKEEIPLRTPKKYKKKEAGGGSKFVKEPEDNLERLSRGKRGVSPEILEGIKNLSG